MTFSFHFLLCTLVIIAVTGILFLFRRLFKRAITARSRYHIWYVFILALLLPFVPYQAFGPGHLTAMLRGLLHPQAAATADPASNTAPALTADAKIGLSDFAVSMDDSAFLTLNVIFHGIWIAGCGITLLYFACNMYQIHSIRKAAYPVTAETEPELYGRYRSCMEVLKIRREVRLYASCRISSPVSYGLILPTVIIPQDMDILLPEDDLRFIFLHELLHYRHKDTVINYLSCALRIIYWFNPLVWYAFHTMQKDREIACDHSVIQTVGKESAVSYGLTLIRFAETLQKNVSLSPLSLLGGEKSVIVQRMKEIAQYRAETRARKLKGICILMLAGLLVYSASPLLTVYAFPDDTYHFSGEHVQEMDLSSYFEGKNGTFVLYDVTEDHYQIYNKELSTTRVSPDSTFKIYSGLFALEEGIISPDASGMAWDGTEYLFDSWNRDQTLRSAMQNSVNWYFQSLDRQNGYAALNRFYRQISYGNCDLTSGIGDYWSEASLKISPVEQVNLLADLLHNKWDFQEGNISAVKDAMFISDTSLGTLYGKTGTGGSATRENVNGWFIGFLEDNGHIYCFAANLRDSEDSTGSAAYEITMNILNTLL